MASANGKCQFVVDNFCQSLSSANWQHLALVLAQPQSKRVDACEITFGQQWSGADVETLRYIRQGFSEGTLGSRSSCSDSQPGNIALVRLAFLSFSAPSSITHFTDKNHQGAKSLCYILKVTLFLRNTTTCLNYLQNVIQFLKIFFLKLPSLLPPLQWLWDTSDPFHVKISAVFAYYNLLKHSQMEK